MNGFSALVLVLAVGAVCAEPPRFRRVQRFRSGNSQFARQEVESTTSTEDATETSDAPYPAAGAPYQPSGWKPSGRLLTLPTERQQQPPATSYGTPDSAYGPPQESTTPADEDQDTPTPNPEAENLSEVEQVAVRGQQPNTGYYFVQFTAPPQAVAPASLRVRPVPVTEQVYFTSPIVVPSRYVTYNSAFTQTW